MRLLVLLLLALFSPGVFLNAQETPLRLELPTRNTALLEYRLPDFYQYTDRRVDGRLTHPWEGGQYGFVRNARETGGGTVFTRFHEGIDIKPVYRDSRDEPLDTVRVIDDGEVVYVNASARGSNYGKYIVVEHWWSGSPFYSLYAHLADTYVREGSMLRRGRPIGRMGYTGSGLNRRRAHLHLEINMLLNDQYDRWHDERNRPGRNPHGRFNGANLAGIDVAGLFLALKRDPNLTIEEFIAREKPYFRIVVPNRVPLDLLYRYPWLAPNGYDAGMRAIEIAFSQSGLPIEVQPSNRRVVHPELSLVQPSNFRYDLATNHLRGVQGNPDISSYGERYLDLLTAGYDYGRSLTLTARSRSGHVIRVPVMPPQKIATGREAEAFSEAATHREYRF